MQIQTSSIKTATQPRERSMRRPEPIWEMDYASDRRKHRHRCLCCNRIIQPGERILMCRVRQKKSYVAHTGCAAKQHTPGQPETTADVMRIWGLEYLKSCGWRVPEIA
jgi:hypothetical protein